MRHVNKYQTVLWWVYISLTAAERASSVRAVTSFARRNVVLSFDGERKSAACQHEARQGKGYSHGGWSFGF